MRASRNTRWFLPLVIGGLMVLLLPAVAFAATEAEKQQAIDDGLKYLAANQDGDGRWDQGDDNYDTAATGAALLSFIEEGYTAGTDVVIDGTNYGDVVGDAIGFLMTRATTVDISSGSPHGNPDVGVGVGAGLGVKFVPGGATSRDTYVTGIVLTALARTGTPNAVVSGGALNGWTHKEIVQNTVDYFAWGQNDSGIARGGWRYSANSGTSDNSTAQWPAIGMLFSQSMGVTTPQFVKDELAVWTDYIQYDNDGHVNDGGSGYDRPYGGTVGISESKTGGLLAEMLLTGSYALTDNEVKDALAYLDRNWDDYASGWYGNFNSPYAMWSIYKGLEGWIGLEGDLSAFITPGAQGSALIDTGDSWNWWEEYCEWLVNDQNTNGSWDGYYYWQDFLATAWHINILNATSVHDPVVPEPSTIALLGLGLAGVAFAARRRRKAG